MGNHLPFLSWPLAFIWPSSVRVEASIGATHAKLEKEAWWLPARHLRHQSTVSLIPTSSAVGSMPSRSWECADVITNRSVNW